MNAIHLSDFDRLRQLLNDETFVDMGQWTQVNSFSELRTIGRSKCDFAGKGGIYSIIDADGHVAYIGKASCLYNRLSSHSKALIGRDKLKAPAWDQFFTSIRHDGLVARYIVIEGFSITTEEYARQVIERALQIKYKPYFDDLYKKKVVIDDFDTKLTTIKALISNS
ncbi:GIY-YIG nuclease family protein [Mucilaginibacter calamicampi]|uniref:GIY-YIG nuclease family protein n=1 Tax=Mucilaginibacter calamicampi TaxID=1302352 RepID=A0ABW2Z3F5_9SPHI